MTQPLTTLDFAVLAAYPIAAVVVALCFARWRISQRAPPPAQRRLPGWAVALALVGQYAGGMALLALSGKAYASGWQAFVFNLSLPVAAGITVVFFVPLYSRSGDVSVYSFLERRLGAWARLYAAGCFLVLGFLRAGGVLFAVALSLGAAFGWDVSWLVVLTGVVVTAFVLAGGLDAVVWIGVFQGLLLTSAGLACVGTVLYDLPDGFGQLVTLAAAQDKFNLGGFASSFWIIATAGLFLNLQNLVADQTYIQYYTRAPSKAAAARAVWVGTTLFFFISALFFFVGTSLFVYYNVWPERLSNQSIAASNPDVVVLHFLTSRFAGGLRGLFVATILGSLFISVGGVLNASATLVALDFYGRFWTKGSEPRTAAVQRTGVLVWGIGSIIAGLTVARLGSLLDYVWECSALSTGGILGLFLLAVLGRSLRPIHVAILLIVSTAIPLVLMGWLGEPIGSGSNLILLACPVTSLALFLGGALLGRPLRPSNSRMTGQG